jgi:hypothetical protein
MISTAGFRLDAVVLGIFASLSVGVAIVQAAPTPAERCQAAKLLGTGRAAKAMLSCAAYGLGEGCRSKADAKLLQAFKRAERAGGCTTIGDGPDLQTEIVMLVDGVQALPSAEPREQVLRAAARAVVNLVRAHVRARRSADPARLAVDLSSVRKTFESGVAREDCRPPVASDVFALIEQAVARFIGHLFPSCGDGVVDAGEGCDGTACPEVGGFSDYECQTPPCQCCAQNDSPCYIRHGQEKPVTFPCCSGFCNVPGPDEFPDGILVRCEPFPTPCPCPCFSTAMIDAFFPPGHFDQNGRGGAVCSDDSDAVVISSADTCIWEGPPLGGAEFTRSAAGVVLSQGCFVPFAPDIDPDDDGNCNTLIGYLQATTPVQEAACIDQLKASQVWQAECQ